MIGASGVAVIAFAATAAFRPASPVTEPADTAAIDTVIEVGTSVEGRSITAVHRLDPDGDDGDARSVLVIGVIHGDEQAGLAIVDRLEQAPVPDGVELYLIDSMNPDGVAADRRTNADLVDLNRNFPYQWGPLGEPGDWQYAGPSAASEPETQAIMAFISEVRPDLVVWYHQDAFMIAPADGHEGEVRAAYAELTGLPLESVTGGTYTGVAATWARHELASDEPDPGIAFIVELGPTLSPTEADTHAAAVLTVASTVL